MNTDTVIIVQARMTSTRLPGKVLMPVSGQPLLDYQLERLRRARKADRIVIATTTNATDDPIVAFCTSRGVDFSRGSEHDVLSRYHEAAERYAAGTVVRVTSDCPFIEPDLIDQAISAFASGDYDYVANMIELTWPSGMAVEVFSARTLAEANREAHDAAEREHVTPFIYWRPDRYRLKSLTHHPNLSEHRWTVDTPEDFELVRRILETLYPAKPAFSMDDVLKLLTEHPTWIAINRHITQKAVAPTKKEA